MSDEDILAWRIAALESRLSALEAAKKEVDDLIKTYQWRITLAVLAGGALANSPILASIIHGMGVP